MTERFSLKFTDVMIGVILGLGFSWWTSLNSTWQYIAFVFVYLNLIDYWIDYSPTLKKYPFINELDIFLHTSIIFSMFFLVYTPQKSITIFLLAFIFYRLNDILWIWRIKKEYKPLAKETIFLKTWTISDFFEAFCALLIIMVASVYNVAPLILMIVFVIIRITSRAFASLQYRALYFAEIK